MTEPPAPDVNVNVTAMTPQQATAKLEELTGNAEWTERLLRPGSTSLSPERKLFDQLIEKKYEADRTGRLLSDAPIEPQIGALNRGGISDQHARDAIGALRDLGISDGSIQELFDDVKYPADVVAAAEQMYREKTREEGWVDLLLSGDPVAQRELILLTQILRVNRGEEEAA